MVLMYVTMYVCRVSPLVIHIVRKDAKHSVGRRDGMMESKNLHTNVEDLV